MPRAAPSTPEPMPANIASTQPGGGLGFELENAWGRLRRWRLGLLRRGYLRRMAALRKGEGRGLPHPILDPRDLKYLRNQTDCHWEAGDDPFAWRRRIPLAGWGLAELQLFGWPLLLLTVALAWYWPPAAIAPAVLLAIVVWFFRDPPRRIAADPGLVVSPADGTIAEVAPVAADPFVGEPAVRIGIFLSIFNVHINRAPVAGRVLALKYAPGQFMNALDPASVLHNENLWIGLEEPAAPYRRMVVRQIAGAIARRIVCDLRPGQTVGRGEKFGMIKFGSRTELVLPAAGLEVLCRVGDRVKAGASVLARYQTSTVEEAQ